MYFDEPDELPDGSRMTSTLTSIRQSFNPEDVAFEHPSVETTCFVRLSDRGAERDMIRRHGSHKFRPAFLDFTVKYPLDSTEPTVSDVRTRGPRVLKDRLSDLDFYEHVWRSGEELPEWVAQITRLVAEHVYGEMRKAARQ